MFTSSWLNAFGVHLHSPQWCDAVELDHLRRLVFATIAASLVGRDVDTPWQGEKECSGGKGKLKNYLRAINWNWLLPLFQLPMKDSGVVFKQPHDVRLNTSLISRHFVSTSNCSEMNEFVSHSPRKTKAFTSTVGHLCGASQISFEMPSTSSTFIIYVYRWIITERCAELAQRMRCEPSFSVAMNVEMNLWNFYCARLIDWLLYWNWIHCIWRVAVCPLVMK